MFILKELNAVECEGLACKTKFDTGASIAEMESESRPRPTLDLDTNNFQSQETNSTASEHQVSRGMAHSVRAIYSTRLALFIHGITSAKVLQFFM